MLTHTLPASITVDGLRAGFRLTIPDAYGFAGSDTLTLTVTQIELQPGGTWVRGVDQFGTMWQFELGGGPG